MPRSQPIHHLCEAFDHQLGVPIYELEARNSRSYDGVQGQVELESGFLDVLNLELMQETLRSLAWIEFE